MVLPTMIKQIKLRILCIIFIMVEFENSLQAFITQEPIVHRKRFAEIGKYLVAGQLETKIRHLVRI